MDTKIVQTRSLGIIGLKASFFILFLILIPFYSSAQKAYEAEFYQCDLKGKRLKLILANGYIGASEIKWADSKNKPVLFHPVNGVPDQNNQLIFNADNDKRSDYFILSNMQEAYEKLPKVIIGQYKSGKQTVIIKFLYIK